MELLTPLFMFFLGTIFGSFLIVVGLRLPQKQSFVNDRSRCDYCNYRLYWYDNIPIISYLWLNGRCRKCHHRISFSYPLIETLTGTLFVWSYLFIGWHMELIVAITLISLLIIICITDITHMVIPNKVLLFYLPLFIILRMIIPLDPWWSIIAGALLGFGIIFIIIVVSKGGMGAGDMKLLGVLGIVLGYEKVLMAFFLSSIIGSFVSILLLLVKKMKRNDAFPFGPFIAIGALISYFCGEYLLNWYLQFFV